MSQDDQSAPLPPPQPLQPAPLTQRDRQPFQANAGGTSRRTIGDYIAECPKDVQPVLEQVRRVIPNAAPGAEEAIKYGIPTFVLNGNLVHFAACQKHIGFYPAPSGIFYEEPLLPMNPPLRFGRVKVPMRECSSREIAVRGPRRGAVDA